MSSAASAGGIVRDASSVFGTAATLVCEATMNSVRRLARRVAS